MVRLEFVPSGVQLCPEFFPSGGFVVSLTSGVMLQTFAVSVTSLIGGTSGVVCFPSEFVVLLTSGMKPQTLAVSVTAYKGSLDPKSDQQQDLSRRAKEKSFHSVEGDPSGLLLLAWVASFCFLIWPCPRPADWSILQSADLSILQSADWYILLIGPFFRELIGPFYRVLIGLF
uniref:Uncharacterized protein n=1 Tax=Papio anubis TaxID=9555 RepID=A0A8I5NQX0_PAPAN